MILMVLSSIHRPTEESGKALSQAPDSGVDIAIWTVHLRYTREQEVHSGLDFRACQILLQSFATSNVAIYTFIHVGQENLTTKKQYTEQYM